MFKAVLYRFIGFRRKTVVCSHTTIEATKGRWRFGLNNSFGSNMSEYGDAEQSDASPYSDRRQ